MLDENPLLRSHPHVKDAKMPPASIHRDWRHQRHRDRQRIGRAPDSDGWSCGRERLTRRVACNRHRARSGGIKIRVEELSASHNSRNPPGSARGDGAQSVGRDSYLVHSPVLAFLYHRPLSRNPDLQ